MNRSSTPDVSLCSNRAGLENYAFSLKNQVNDEDGLGGKIDAEDKETVSGFRGIYV